MTMLAHMKEQQKATSSNGDLKTTAEINQRDW